MQVTKGTWCMREQCVPSSLSSSPAREPGNGANCLVSSPDPTLSRGMRRLVTRLLIAMVLAWHSIKPVLLFSAIKEKTSIFAHGMYKCGYILSPSMHNDSNGSSQQPLSPSVFPATSQSNLAMHDGSHLALIATSTAHKQSLLSLNATVSYNCGQ